MRLSTVLFEWLLLLCAYLSNFGFSQLELISSATKEHVWLLFEQNRVGTVLLLVNKKENDLNILRLKEPINSAALGLLVM